MQTIFTLLSVCLFTTSTNAQQTYSPCDASPFCSDTNYVFPNISSGVTAPSGPDYGCLGSEPNPAWYYMQIGTSGSMQLTVVQTSATGQGLDVDFAMWGPYPDLATGCADVMSGNAPPIQCSYDANTTEVIGLGLPGGSGVGYGNPPNPPGGTTPPSAIAGEVYIILLTNYSQQAGTIDFGQTDGTGSADCGIVCGLHTTTDSVACATYPFNLGAYNNNDTDFTYTYQWTGPFNLTSTAQNPTFTINQAGTYTFDVMSISNEDDTCYQTADIVILPGGTTTTDVSICQGESYNFFGKEYYEAGLYDTLFHNIQGCDSIIALNLTVNPLPNVSMKQERSLDLCSGDSVRIGIDHPETGVTYQWQKDGSDLSGETEPSLMIHGGGTYVLNATTGFGCKASTDPVMVTGRDKPEAQIAPLSNEVICAYDTLQLSAQNPQSGYSYTWEPAKPFRTEAGNEGEKVTGVFLEPTQVSLTVYNRFGCNSSDTTFVQTKPCCEVFMPTAFTPNGDGTNDYFKPNLQVGQVLVSMKIYNRLGQLVYNNKNIKTGWDGRFDNGTPGATDTYMYLIEYTCADGKLYHKKGDVSLIR